MPSGPKVIRIERKIAKFASGLIYNFCIFGLDLRHIRILAVADLRHRLGWICSDIFVLALFKTFSGPVGFIPVMLNNVTVFGELIHLVGVMQQVDYGHTVNG